MKIVLVSNVEPEDESFNEPLLKSLTPLAEVETIHYAHVPPVAELEARFDGIVTSGTPLSYPLDDIDTRVAHIQWMRDITIPVLGICLGHQNIGRLFGSQLFLGEEAEEGLRALHIVQDDPLFKGVQSGEKVVEHHRASVNVPDGFVLLASTATCRNQTMKHATKPLYSVQFHPELSEATGPQIFKNFVGMLG
ncbi:MAG TPA: hypothetical protein VLF60_05360 [Candidatus Saccharimonadales bacterium]|nr:hypothetical protein [Candidatus Saccharimonadales bacterium]